MLRFGNFAMSLAPSRSTRIASRAYVQRGRAALCAALLAAGVLAAAPARAQAPAAADIAVEARNLTTPELCAEKDNVQIDFAAPDVRSFQLRAVHPAYIGTIVTDRWAPDLTSCEFHPTNEGFAEKGERITIWESTMMQLVGYRIPEFWRPANTDVRVGDKVVKGLQIVQLFFNYRERAEEALVFYPPDGYWRARPFPFGDMRWTAYGSSFLVGPVEIQERPIVDLSEVAFDPKTKTFTLSFRRGGSAKMKVAEVNQEQFQLDVTFDGAPTKDYPFASLRSMYASETNSDAARIAWRGPGAKSWRETDVFGLKTEPAVELWLGRRLPSRHNTSAPDMIVSHFKK
jgi:hypothetical protein